MTAAPTTKQSLCIHSEKEGYSQIPLRLYFEDGKSIMAHECLINIEGKLGKEFRKHYDDARASLSLIMMEFDAHRITPSQAEELSLCSYISRPD
jgi:hypothetical protein